MIQTTRDGRQTGARQKDLACTEQPWLEPGVQVASTRCMRTGVLVWGSDIVVGKQRVVGIFVVAREVAVMLRRLAVTGISRWRSWSEPLARTVGILVELE